MKTLEERLALIEEKLGLGQPERTVWLAVCRWSGSTAGVRIYSASRDCLSEKPDSQGDYEVLSESLRDCTGTYVNKKFVANCSDELRARLLDMFNNAFSEVIEHE